MNQPSKFFLQFDDCKIIMLCSLCFDNSMFFLLKLQKTNTYYACMAASSKKITEKVVPPF
jgi:hypothetical protein